MIQINPGDGYRLLEPGEVAVKGEHECRSASNCKGDWGPVRGIDGEPVLSDGTVHWHGCRFWVRRRITPEPSRWIPVTENPLPESGEVLCQWPDGDKTVWDCTCKPDIPPVAWMSLPEPYVPPVTERVELWMNRYEK